VLPEVLLVLGVLVVAVLYSSVGHAGGSGYIAVMSLLSLSPDFIKPTALALNVLVASVAAWQFWRAGHFSFRLFWPFVLLAVPASFLGGYLTLPARLFQIVVGLLLLCSAAWLLVQPSMPPETREPSRPAAFGLGAGIGLVAGLTGTGGGIFLTPLLLLFRWATPLAAGAVTAPFILLNSASGLFGHISATGGLPALAAPLAVAAIVGGTVGSYFGSRRLPTPTVKRLLAVVLVVAGFKLILVP
jgi:uncharacterized membrane protein YfcA